MNDVLHSDIERLAETHGRGYPRGKRVLSWGFYTWRRAMGGLLIPRIPDELAFTDVRTPKRDIFRRQLLSWGKRGRRTGTHGSGRGVLPVAAALDELAALGRLLGRRPDPVLVEQRQRCRPVTRPPIGGPGCRTAAAWRRRRCTACRPMSFTRARQGQAVRARADDGDVEVDGGDLLAHVLERVEPRTRIRTRSPRSTARR